jgi:DNA polymerase-3 subunit gamma/tau
MGAFNALLKTLEEPPEHVKFILATTEVQKVPATIQSRCQRFNFRHIDAEAIEKRLDQIIREEGARAEPGVTRRIARLASGSMRDALSILDQLMSVEPANLTTAALNEIIPPAQDEQVFTLLKHAADGDAPAALRTVDAVLSGGRGLEVFCNDTIEVLRTLMLIQSCGADAPMVDIPAGAGEAYVNLAGRFQLSHYVQMIAMFEELKRNVRFSGAGRALTDALVVRLAHLLSWPPIEKLIEQVSGGRPAGATTAVSTAAASAEKKKSALERPESDSTAPLPAGERIGAGTSALENSTLARHDRANVPEDSTLPRPLPGREGGDAGSAAAARVEASHEERDRARLDPVVKRLVELFDGVVISVERYGPVATAENPE